VTGHDLAYRLAKFANGWTRASWVACTNPQAALLVHAGWLEMRTLRRFEEGRTGPVAREYRLTPAGWKKLDELRELE
jgi:hypothetical protein